VPVRSPVLSPAPAGAAAARAGGTAAGRGCWLAGAYYLVAAVAVTMWLWRDPASRVVAVNPFDSDQAAWFLRYDASAVARLRLPALVTSGMNAPAGVNLMWNTPMLLPGVALAPLTLLAGPQASLTVLMTAGFAGSALAMFAVLRGRGASAAAAGAGGLVYGFSPALVASGLGHYDLQFAVLPPLIADAALRLAVPGPGAGPGGGPAAGRRQAVRDGARLGLLAAAQLFITEELLFDSAVAIAILLAVLAASRPRAVRAGAARLAAGGATAAAVVALIAGYPLREQFAGPLRQRGSPFTLDFYKNDLAGFVRPSSQLLLHTRASAEFAAAFQGGPPEYLGYLGWPMLAVLAVTAARYWRQLPVRAASVTFAVLEVASLGGTLLAGGHELSWLKLPWYWVQGLPLASSVIPDRFSILADGAAAGLLAFGLDSAGLFAVGPGAGRKRRLRRAVTAAVALAALVPLIPRPLPAATAPPVPAGWTGVLAELRLPASAPVLVVPVPMASFTEPLRWEADTGVPASMIGGYFIGPARDGRAATDGSGPAAGELFLNRLWAGSARADERALAGGQGAERAAQLRAELAASRAAAVVAVTTPRSPLGKYLAGVLGRPAARGGQVLGWRVPAWRPPRQG
jgi:hypothetical protein